MRVRYRTYPNTEWQTYRCFTSGNQEFDLYDGAYRIWTMVRCGNAVEAEVYEGEQVLARWVWNEAVREARKEFGPDL